MEDFVIKIQLSYLLITSFLTFIIGAVYFFYKNNLKESTAEIEQTKDDFKTSSTIQNGQEFQLKPTIIDAGSSKLSDMEQDLVKAQQKIEKLTNIIKPLLAGKVLLVKATNTPVSQYRQMLVYGKRMMKQSNARRKLEF